MALVRAWGGQQPRLADGVFVADGAVVVGDVEIGPGSSVWFGAILRGDVNHIRVGARTNVQDQSILHVTAGTHPTTVGDDVTIGHRVVLHGCTVRDRCLVGIGAIVLDGAVVGEESMVGAGALVPPGMVVPPRTLALGSPARVKRELTAEEIAFFRRSAANYAAYAASYRKEGFPGP
jgi:carbonic anhydrase/acetyltransferase-like protein (isoleucine patch superfamily)